MLQVREIFAPRARRTPGDPPGTAWGKLMARITPVALAALAASLSLVTAPALAQTPAPPGAAAATPAAPVDTTAAERRARELVAALGAGEAGALDRYLQEAGAPAYLAGGPLARLRWADFLMGDRPVLEFVRDARARSAVAVVRNPVTGRLNSLFVAIEAEAPHRITRAVMDPFTAPPEDYRPTAPSTEGERMARLDAYAAGLAALDRFSGIVVVARGDEIILERAYGLADRGFRVPNTVDTRFNVASIDKIFTALAAARLVEQGRLSYEDPLSKFLPFPDPTAAEKIRLKHLLSHTSGLGDYITPRFDEIRASFAGLNDYMAYLESLKPLELDFEPGARWSYSNMGMLLVGKIVEDVSGEDYYDHIQKVIFDPAGMSMATDLVLTEITPRVANLYEISPGDSGMQWRNATPELPGRSAPDGGSVATGRDLVRLASAIRSGVIVSPETFEMMAAPKDELGARGRYGFGVMNMNQRLGARGRDVVGHGGDVNGGCASFAMVRDAGEPYTIVVLSNSFMGSCFPVGEVALEMIPPLASQVGD